MVDIGELRSFLISFGRVFVFFQCVHSIPCVNKSGKITNTVLLKNYFYSSLTVISSWNYYAAKHEGTLDRSRRSTTNNFLFFFKFLHGKSLETKFDQMLFFNLTQRYRRAQTSSTTVGYHAHYLDTGSRNVFFQFFHFLITFELLLFSSRDQRK